MGTYRVVVKSRTNFATIASAWGNALRGNDFRIGTQDVNKWRRNVVLDLGNGRHTLMIGPHGRPLTHGKRPPGSVWCPHGRDRSTCGNCTTGHPPAQVLQGPFMSNVGTEQTLREQAECAAASEDAAWTFVDKWKLRFEVVCVLWIVTVVVAVVAYLMK